MKSVLTWRTDAPHLRNWIEDSAESIPPVAKIGNPGRARATAETALKATGRTAFPETPPYVVRLSRPTPGQGSPFPLRPMRPERVLVAVTPSAFPKIY